MKPDYSKSKIYILKSQIGKNYFIYGSTLDIERLTKVFKTAYNKYMPCLHRDRGPEQLTLYRKYFRVIQFNDFTVEHLEIYNCKSRKELNERVKHWKTIYENNRIENNRILGVNMDIINENGADN